MIIKYILLLTISTYLLAIETVHSSLSAYAENKTYTGSKQKEDGMVCAFGADLHYGNAEYKLTYKEGSVNTIQPPMIEDLEIKKLYFKFDYKFDRVKVKFSSITKYIDVQDGNSTTQTYASNAESKYITTAVEVHAHYNQYYLGGSAYFGKRAFCYYAGRF